MVQRSLSLQHNQIIELLQYAKQYTMSIGLHCEFEGDHEEDYEIQIAEQCDLFYTYLGQNPDHLDVHKDIPDRKTENALIAFANYYQIPLRKRGDSFIPYKQTDGVRYLGSGKTQQELSERFDSLQDNYTYEIVFHPGLYDPDSASSLNLERENDIRMIKRIHTQFTYYDLKLIIQHDL
ncbi:MAG TPA: ChbG/HpnK family deacetylase [Candidatus Absconditabacterales bacterium]|nr:ChbG/HpnK family deacetylase [Candidatus Absconditabacterales bacterium]